MGNATINKQPGSMIFIAGLATSFVCLLAVYFINLTGFEPMGFYLWHILPLGALVVGLCSGSGYAIGSRLSNVRISKGFLLFVALLGLATYAAAQYLTYLHILDANGISTEEVSFIDYIKYTWENMTYGDWEGDSEPYELGKLGYALKALEVAGFTLGVMLPVWILRQASYCPACQRYMSRTGSFFMISETGKSDLKKMKRKEKEEIINAVLQRLKERNDELLERISETGFDETLLALSDLPRKNEGGYVAVVQYDLKKCPTCDSHQITATLRNINAGNQYNARIVAKLPKLRDHAEV